VSHGKRRRDGRQLFLRKPTRGLKEYVEELRGRVVEELRGRVERLAGLLPASGRRRGLEMRTSFLMRRSSPPAAPRGSGARLCKGTA
jgi:hypothetical protein